MVFIYILITYLICAVKINYIYVFVCVLQLLASNLRFDFILLLCGIYYLYSTSSDVFFFLMVKCGSRSRQLGLMPVISNSLLLHGFKNNCLPTFSK